MYVLYINMDFNYGHKRARRTDGIVELGENTRLQ